MQFCSSREHLWRRCCFWWALKRSPEPDSSVPLWLQSHCSFWKNKIKSLHEHWYISYKMSSAITDFQARNDLPISVTVWQPKWQVAENLRKMKKRLKEIFENLTKKHYLEYSKWEKLKGHWWYLHNIGRVTSMTWGASWYFPPDSARSAISSMIFWSPGNIWASSSMTSDYKHIKQIRQG